MQAADGLVLPYQPRQTAPVGGPVAAGGTTNNWSIYGDNPQETAALVEAKINHHDRVTSTGYRGA